MPFGKRGTLAVATAIVFLASIAGASGGRLPGVTAFEICAAAGPYWPTQTLAIEGTTAWIACKEESRLQRFDVARGRVAGTVRLDGAPIAVASGFGSIWALDTGATLYRIAPGSARIVKRISLGASAPYNIWVGAGSVWVVDDAAGEVIRVAPATGRVRARIAVGDGPSDMVFAGTSAWIVNHRDRGLLRLDTRTNRPTRLATLDGDAPERIAFLGGRLWITGRGTDLLRVRPDTGSVEATIDIGASGIDVVAVAGALWVPARAAAVDRRGFPTAEAVRRITPGGAVTTVVRARGRVDVHGLAAGPGAASVWLADNTSGTLYRLPSRSR